MNIRTVAHNSADYWRSVDLRRKVLRTPLGLDFTAHELAHELHEVVFVAIDEGKLLGCLHMVPSSEAHVKMRQVAVEPSDQGQGIGRALITESERWAVRQGYESIVLHARSTVVAFYESLGYHAEGDPFMEVGIAHRRMVKRLP